MTIATTLAIGVALFATVALAADEQPASGKATLYPLSTIPSPGTDS